MMSFGGIGDFQLRPVVPQAGMTYGYANSPQADSVATHAYLEQMNPALYQTLNTSAIPLIPLLATIAAHPSLSEQSFFPFPYIPPPVPTTATNASYPLLPFPALHSYPMLSNYSPRGCVYPQAEINDLSSLQRHIDSQLLQASNNAAVNVLSYSDVQRAPQPNYEPNDVLRNGFPQFPPVAIDPVSALQGLIDHSAELPNEQSMRRPLYERRAMLFGGDPTTEPNMVVDGVQDNSWAHNHQMLYNDNEFMRQESDVVVDGENAHNLTREQSRSPSSTVITVGGMSEEMDTVPNSEHIATPQYEDLSEDEHASAASNTTTSATSVHSQAGLLHESFVVRCHGDIPSSTVSLLATYCCKERAGREAFANGAQRLVFLKSVDRDEFIECSQGYESAQRQSRPVGLFYPRTMQGLTEAQHGEAIVSTLEMIGVLGLSSAVLVFDSNRRDTESNEDQIQPADS